MWLLWLMDDSSWSACYWCSVGVALMDVVRVRRNVFFSLCGGHEALGSNVQYTSHQQDKHANLLLADPDLYKIFCIRASFRRELSSS